MSIPYVPHPFQEKAIEFLLTNGGAGLFAVPGAGKTSTVLAAQKILKSTGHGGPMLVFAPMRVAQYVWTDERDKWEDFSELKVVVLQGTDRAERMVPGADVYVVNYENLEWFFDNDGIAKTGVTTLVCDESTKLKNPTGVRFRKLRENLNHFTRRWILTGTPTPNGLEDLWAQMFILDGGLSLGRYVTHFRSMYFYREGYGGYNLKLMVGSEEKIYERIRPYVMRVEAQEYMQLPELNVSDVYVELPPKARKTYEELRKHFITMVNDQTVTAVSKGVALGKCLQVCNGALYTENPAFAVIHDAKIEALRDLFESFEGSAPLIFYQYDHDRIRLEEAFPFLPRIGHGVGEKATRTLIDAFNNDQLPGLLAQPGSVGHGLQLQGAARHVVFFGVPHDLDLYEQPIARVWRQGNPNKRVFVHRILARDTFDVQVATRLAEKNASLQSLLTACSEAP